MGTPRSVMHRAYLMPCSTSVGRDDGGAVLVEAAGPVGRSAVATVGCGAPPHPANNPHNTVAATQRGIGTPLSASTDGDVTRRSSVAGPVRPDPPVWPCASRTG